MFNQPPMTVRHGDVGLLLVSPPPRQGRRRKLGRTLAEGEVTGQQERWNILEVICPSQGHTPYLWVPPDIHSREDNPPGYTLCHIAVAWTFGFEGADVANYRPVAEA